MERTGKNASFTHALIQSLLHLFCRLIRKSQHQNLLGQCLTALNQKPCTPHHRTRLASTRTGQHQIIILIYHTSIALALAQRIILHLIKISRKLFFETTHILHTKIFHLLIAPVRHLLHQRKISIAIQSAHRWHLAKLIEHLLRHRPDLQPSRTPQIPHIQQSINLLRTPPHRRRKLLILLQPIPIILQPVEKPLHLCLPQPLQPLCSAIRRQHQLKKQPPATQYIPSRQIFSTQDKAFTGPLQNQPIG